MALFGALRKKFGKRRRVPAAIAVVLTLLVLLPFVARPAHADLSSVVGQNGTFAQLPPTASAKTVAGDVSYPNLKVTVNQTQDLVNQAISVSYSGVPANTYLAVFQCWGDDPAKGPLPSNCEYGAPKLGNTQGYIERLVSSTTPGAVADPSADGRGLYWMPFTDTAGTTVGEQHSADPCFVRGNNGAPCTGQWWHNTDYDYTTTNEIDKSISSPAVFTVDTALEAPGLGCGGQEPTSSGGTTVRNCWLEVVPNPTFDQFNYPGGALSALDGSVWKDRISIPLGFQPVDNGCNINASARQVVGSELLSPAMASWQPALCAGGNGTTYSYAGSSDDSARLQLESAGASGGMSVMTQPLNPTTQAPADPVVYAPMALSGAVIGLNIQRAPSGNVPQSSAAYRAETKISGSTMLTINLTPRLLAKLLTDSYQDAIPKSVWTAGQTTAYKWVSSNPASIFNDPEFLQYNPEFQLLTAALGFADTSPFASLVVEVGSSDAAAAVWKWIAVDPEAMAWLGGAPDATSCPAGDPAPSTCVTGMQVNPAYSTSAASNPSGQAFDPTSQNTYPRLANWTWTGANSDPLCFLINPDGTHTTTFPALHELDWEPYSLNMQTAALAARTTNVGTKTTPSCQGYASSPYRADGPETPGEIGGNFVLSITDAASAAQYGLQTASLSHAGDDTAGRSFVAPDTAGLTAGALDMKTDPASGVQVPNVAATASGAYPLTMLAYGAVAPGPLDQSTRNDYANLITYAAGTGQTPGTAFGNLPAGYSPLPPPFRQQAVAAAALIRAGGPGVSSPSPVAPTTTAVPTSTAPSMPSSSSVLSGGTTVTSSPLVTPLAQPVVTSAPTATATPLSRSAFVQQSPKGSKTPDLSVGVARLVLPIVIVLAAIALVAGPISSRAQQLRRRKVS
jgi:hypothetical protein